MNYSDGGVIRVTQVSRCIVITGMSGAGKSAVLRILEDRGFFASDNLPPIMMPEFLRVLSDNRAAVSNGVAVVTDIRGEGLLEDLFVSIDEIKKNVGDVKLLFLDAADDWLVRRYETTRRRHPLGKGVTIMESISKERRRLEAIKERSDIVMDTSSMMPGDLRSALLTELGMNDDPLTVIVSSFGFKHGTPKDCDYMFDARFLPNPNYVPELKKLSGCDRPVRDYLSKVSAKSFFMDRLISLTDFVLMQYDISNTGKKQIHIAVGCTGGRHRSVAIAEELSAALSDRGHKVVTNHRDINREALDA